MKNNSEWHCSNISINICSTWHPSFVPNVPPMLPTIPHNRTRLHRHHRHLNRLQQPYRDNLGQSSQWSPPPQQQSHLPLVRGHIKPPTCLKCLHRKRKCVILGSPETEDLKGQQVKKIPEKIIYTYLGSRYLLICFKKATTYVVA